MTPELVAGRWKLSEFIFVEFVFGFAIYVDIGPFQQIPDDAETEKAYTHLQEAALPFLTLGNLDWTLDLQKLTETLPILADRQLSGLITHPPAFETFHLFEPIRLFNRGTESTDVNFLRIHFSLTEAAKDETSTSSEDPFPPDWTPPPNIVT